MSRKSLVPIQLPADPTAALEAATKQYVDARALATRNIATTAPLTGGGDLSADRTLAISAFAGSAAGAVPASAGGTANFLRADGTWASPPTGTLADGDKGEITVTSGVWTIDADVVTNTKIAPMPTLTIKGNNTGSTAGPTDLTATQVTAMLNVFTSSLAGLVPSSGGGTTNFLRADGSWQPAGGASIDATRSMLVDWVGGNPAPAYNILLGTNSPVGRIPVWAFDAAAIEYVHGAFLMPQNYGSGGTLRINCVINNITAGNAVFAARVSAVTPGDADTPLEHAWSTAASVTIANNTAEARRVLTGTITLNMDSVAPGDTVQILFYRDATNGSDTTTIDAEVINVAFEYESA